MIKETKINTTIESIHDTMFGLVITNTDKIITEIKYFDISTPEQKPLWVISNKEKELGNFLLLMRRYLEETKTI
jgi:hypothetical protein